jgi:Mlc titration factor MtfA (ptsG expression regulator)
MRRWWHALCGWQERRTLRTRGIPDELWRSTVERFSFLASLNEKDALRLRELATLFLARKEFTGAGGLRVTDEMAVAVATQACLPVLELGLHWYDGFVGIVMHPDEVVAPREVVDDVGVVHHYDEPLAGEAMEGGPMTLSWRDVAGASHSDWAYNVVIHEFAHVLDMRRGGADGVPPLASRAAHDHWVRVMESSHERFCRQVDAGMDTVLDPYGAESPAEFFAVACEAFFVAGARLRNDDVYLYDLMRDFFRQDPASREPAVA